MAQLGDSKRTLALLGSVCLCAATLRTASAADADAAQGEFGAAIVAMNADSYYARERATAWLREQGSAVIPALIEAAGGDNLEVTCRAVQILRDLSIDRDLDTADQAADALRHLADSGFTSSAQRAALALRFHAEARSRRSLEAVQKLGGVMDHGDNFQGVMTERLLLSKNWEGGDAGLSYLKWLDGLENLSIRCSKVTDEGIAHLKPLTNLAKLELYGTRISDEGLAQLQQALPHTTIDRRAGALLGIRGMPNNNGCEILFIKPESAADEAGLQTGDIIIEFDGQPIDSFEALTALISKHVGGDKVGVKFTRGGDLQETEVTLGEWE
ncbi:MAG: PDZ domain-containing protein [Pirellulales bacterium]